MSNSNAIGQGGLTPTWSTGAPSVTTGALKKHRVANVSPDSGTSGAINQLGTSTLSHVNSPTAALHFTGRNNPPPEGLVNTAASICVLEEDFRLLGNLFDEAAEEFANERYQSQKTIDELGAERYEPIKTLDLTDKNQAEFADANTKMTRASSKLNQAKARLESFEQSAEKHDLDSLQKQLAELKEHNPQSKYIGEVEAKLNSLNKKYEDLMTAVKDAESNYQAAQQNYEEAKVVLAKSVPEIASKIDNLDKKKAAIKIAFENYSKNAPNALDNLKEAIQEGKSSLAAQTSAKRGFDSKETAASREERTEKKADRKAEPFQKESAAPGEFAALRRATYPGATAPTAQTERPVDPGAARSESATRSADQPATLATAATDTKGSETVVAHADQRNQPPQAEARMAARVDARTSAGQPDAAKAATADASHPSASQPARTTTPTPEPDYVAMAPVGITPQTLHSQREEVIKLKQQLQQLTPQIATTPPGGGTGPQPNQRLPIQGETVPNPQIAPLIAKLEGIETQLTQAIQEFAPPVPPKPGATASTPTNAQTTSAPPGPSVQERIEKQAERQEKAKNLLLQAQEARAQATTIIAQEESVRRTGQPAAERVAQAAAGGPEHAREGPQPQPAPAAEAQSGGGQQRGGGQQQQQQGQGPQQAAKPEARVGASQKTFADGYTGTVETHEWGTTARLIKTIGGKEFHVTLDFYKPVDDAKINEYLNERASKEKIEKMMKEYAVFSQIGNDLILESTYSGGTLMRYTNPSDKRRTADLSNPLGFLNGKIETYDSKIAKAENAGEHGRVRYLEAKRVKMNNILKEYEILVLGKHPKTGKLDPKATVLGQGAPAAAAPVPQPAQAKQPPPISPKPLRSLASFNADFKSKLQREPSFKSHLENGLREREISLTPKQLEELTVIYMQLIYATNINERDEISKKARNFADLNQLFPRDKFEDAMTDAFVKSEKDIRDLLHFRLADTSPELIQKIKVSTTYQQYINDHYADVSPETTAKLQIALGIYQTATSSRDLENKLRDNGITDIDFILDALMCFEEDAQRLKTAQETSAARPAAPTGPLPKLPPNVELSKSYADQLQANKQKYESIRINAEAARQKEEETRKLAETKLTELVRNIEQTNEIKNIDISKVNAYQLMQSLYRLRNQNKLNAQDVREFERILDNYQEARRNNNSNFQTDLKITTEITTKLTGIQNLMKIADDLSKKPGTSDVAKEEFKRMIEILTIINTKVNIEGRDFDKNKLYSNQTEVLADFISLQQARERNENVAALKAKFDGHSSWYGVRNK